MDLALQMHLRSVQSCFSHSWMLAGFFLLTFWEFDEKKMGPNTLCLCFLLKGSSPIPISGTLLVLALRGIFYNMYIFLSTEWPVPVSPYFNGRNIYTPAIEGSNYHITVTDVAWQAFRNQCHCSLKDNPPANDTGMSWDCCWNLKNSSICFNQPLECDGARGQILLESLCTRCCTNINFSVEETVL